MLYDGDSLSKFFASDKYIFFFVFCFYKGFFIKQETDDWQLILISLLSCTGINVLDIKQYILYICHQSVVVLAWKNTTNIIYRDIAEVAIKRKCLSLKKYIKEMSFFFLFKKKRRHIEQHPGHNDITAICRVKFPLLTVSRAIHLMRRKYTAPHCV